MGPSLSARGRRGRCCGHAPLVIRRGPFRRTFLIVLFTAYFPVWRAALLPCDCGLVIWLIAATALPRRCYGFFGRGRRRSFFFVGALILCPRAEANPFSSSSGFGFQSASRSKAAMPAHAGTGPAAADGTKQERSQCALAQFIIAIIAYVAIINFVVAARPCLGRAGSSWSWPRRWWVATAARRNCLASPQAGSSQFVVRFRAAAAPACPASRRA
jgi:hypothetical protein